jgi:transposase InsO family protein
MTAQMQHFVIRLRLLRNAPQFRRARLRTVTRLVLWGIHCALHRPAVVQLGGFKFHHDRGAQYMSKDFRAYCDRHHVKQSVGRIGSSQDNAVAESFRASLKRELVSRCRFATRADARRAIIAWV